MAEDTAKEKGKATAAAKKRAQVAEQAQLVAEKRLAEMETKLGGVELKLAEAKSLTLSQVDEIAYLKAFLDASEEKGYNEGFVDAENFVEPIVFQARHHEFSEGWLAALQTMGVAEDSPLRNPEQIPYPTPAPLVQSQVGTVDKEETLSMRELVHAIDTHVDMVDLEVTSNPHATEGRQGQTLTADQPTKNAPAQHADDVIQLLPNDPYV